MFYILLMCAFKKSSGPLKLKEDQKRENNCLSLFKSLRGTLWFNFLIITLHFLAVSYSSRQLDP